MRSFKAGQPLLYGLAMLFLIVVAGGLAEAKTLNVANNGVDSLTCGDKKSPCRSISIAIDNANPGDKIVVGPGHYGDLDEDTDFNDAGEEKAEGQSGCDCMIKVNKQLTIESRDGAGATVLDARGANIDVVRIQVSGVIFGKKKKGFTLTHGAEGLFINNGTNGVRVESNLAITNSFDGFNFFGSGHVLNGNTASGNGSSGFGFSGSGHLLSNNIASANDSSGFEFSGSGHVLSGNIARANVSTGFGIIGSGHLLTGNLASGNDSDGFAFFGGNGNVLSGNTAVDNTNDGFAFNGTGHLLTDNSAVGNQAKGISVVGSGSSATITKNNIFGNHGSCGPGDNIGLRNGSGGAINATNNFWGAATGPGADPADDICNAGAGSSTTVAPFATKEFKVKVKALDEIPREVAPVVSSTFAPVLESNYELKLYTLTGQLIASISNSTQLASASHSLANGMYLAVKVYADGRRELHRLMILRGVGA